MKFKSAVPAILILILISAAEGFSQPLVSPVAVLPEGRTEFISGDVFTVRIDVGTNEAVSSLYGVSFVLNYNSSLLTATQATASDFLGADPVFFQTLESGEVAIGMSAKTGSGSDGSGTVAEVTFQISAGASSGATANFQITDVVAVDPSGTDMTLSGGTEDITIYTGAEITPSTTDVSIGNVNVGSIGSGTFTITNNGDIGLAVSSVTSSNSPVFTTDYAGGGTIAPAGNQVVTVTFTPTAAGAQSSTITVTSNDDDESTIYVTVTGTGIGPEITLSATTVEIGNVSLGASGSGTFTITNDGNEDLIVNSVTSSNPPVFTTDYADGGTIAPAENQLVTVTFSPTSLGAQSATITVTSNDGDEATITVNATGTGTAPEISLSTTSVDIGNVSLGSSSTGTFTITNDGNEDLIVSSITSDNGVFAVSPYSATLAPGANQPVTITFSPTTAGAQSAAITVTSNDADEATVTVTINGTGLSPDITLSTTIVAIGNVALGSNGSGSFTITNDGGADLTITSIASDNTLFTVSPSSVTIAPGGNQLVIVTFSPDAAGAQSATVTISTDQGNLTVTATGTGIAPDITLSDASVSIGNVNAGSTGSGSFTITNNGDADLVVTSITSDNALFTISPSSATIAPGGNQIVTISFSPTASGTRNSIITILSNDTDEGTLTLTASGNGSAPEIGLSTNSLSLGGITVGESGSADFTIHNSGIGDLVISSISSDNGSFTVDPSSATIASGGSNAVTITFSPTTIGAQSATITVNSNDTDEGTLTVTVGGSGIGTTAGPEITLSAASVSIGNVELGSSGSGSLTIENIGNENLVVSSITSDNDLFSVSPSAATVAPEGSQTVTVTFNPTAAGARSATITITSNDPDEGTLSVAVSGTAALAPEIDISAGALDFGNALPRTSASSSLTIANKGTAVLVVSSITSSNSEFTVDPKSASIQPGESLTVMVTFSTTTAGSKTATITVVSNDSDESTLTINFTGNVATEPEIALSTTSLSIGSVNIGGSGSASFNIKNEGTRNLSISSITSNNSLFNVNPGTAIIAEGGSIPVTVTFTPANAGDQSSTITILSNDSDEKTLTVSVSATGVSPVSPPVPPPVTPTQPVTPSGNMPPVFVSPPSVLTVDPGVTATQVLSATDPEGQAVSLSITELPANASFNPASGGFSITADVSQSGESYQIVCEAADPEGLKTIHTFTVQVNVVNLPPVFENFQELVTVEPGGTAGLTIKATDPEGEAVTLTFSDLPANASFDPASGSFSITANMEQAGQSYQVVFKTVDPEGLTATATLTVSVLILNRPPVFEPLKDLAVEGGVPLQLTVSAMDPDGDPVTITAQGVPISELGAAFDPETGILSWTPPANVAKNYRLVFIATDTRGGKTELAVTISAGAVNRPPVIQPISDKEVAAENKLEFTFTATDPDGDKLTLSAGNRPSGAVVTFEQPEITLAASTYGPATGTFTWTPTPEQVGTYNVSFTVRDKSLTALEEIVIRVLGVNRVPVLGPLSDRSVSEGQLLTFQVTATDPDKDIVTLAVQNLPSGAGFDPSTGMFSFKPGFDQAGDYTVTFTAADPGGLTDSRSVKITVGDLNNPPRLGELTNQTVRVGETLTIGVTADDPDGDPLTYEVQMPSGASYHELVRILQWTPQESDVGTHQVSVTVTDGKGGKDSRTILITVTLEGVTVNQPPVIEPIGDQSIETGKTLSFEVKASDPDGAPVVLSANGSLPEGALFDPLTGKFSFTPQPEQEGEHTVTFTASDSRLSTQETIIIEVSRLENLPPVISGVQDRAVPAGQSLSFVVSVNDPEGDETTLSATGLPRGADFNSASGTFSFTPGFHQAGSYELEFTAIDHLGASSQSSMKLKVTAVNRPPAFDPIPKLKTTVDESVEFVVNATDPDGDALTYTAPNAADLGASFDPATRMLSWTPTAFGNYQIIFTVKDSRGGKATTLAQVTVTDALVKVNQPPEFETLQNYVIDPGSSLSFTVKATDPDGDPLTYDILNNPLNSGFDPHTLTFTFNPTPDQAGVHKPAFTVTDGKMSDEVTVEIKVNRANRPPVIEEIPDRTVPERKELSFFVTARDPDGDPLVLSAVGLPEGAGFNKRNGRFRFRPGTGQAGSYDVKFVCNDPYGLEDSKVMNIRVTQKNQPPVLGFIDNQEIMVGETLELGITVADPNDPLTALTFSILGLPDGAVFSASDRVFRWTPGPDQTVNHRVTFIVADPAGKIDKRRIKITVKDPIRPVNHPPVLEPIGNKLIQETQNLSFTVRAADPDAGNMISLSVRGLPQGAAFTSQDALNEVSGSFNFTPDLQQSGQYELTFTATDGDFVDEETVVLTVSELNVLPLFYINAKLWGSRGPFLQASGNYVVNAGSVLNISLIGSDAGGEEVVLSIQNPPPNSSFMPSTGMFSFTPGQAQAGQTYEVAFRATDASENYTETTVIIEVKDLNQPPVLRHTPNQSSNEEELVEFTVQADDPNSDELTYSVKGLPEGASVDASGLLFRWIPASGQSGNYQVTFTATDPGGLSDQITINITVGTVNMPPLLEVPNFVEASEGETFSFTVRANDPEGDQIGISMPVGPEGASFTDRGDGTGVFEWIPGYGDAGNYKARFTASDSINQAGADAGILVKDVRLLPEISFQGSSSGVMLAAQETKFKHSGEGIRLAADVDEILTFTVEEGSELLIEINIEDIDEDLNAVAVRNLPQGAAFDWENSRIIFRPDYDQQGDYLVLVQVADGLFTIDQYLALRVIDVNRPPVLRPIGERYVDEGKIISFEVDAYDPDDDSLSFSFSSRPQEASLVNNLFTLDTKLLSTELQIEAFRFASKVFDGKGGQDSLAHHLAVIRSDTISFIDEGSALAGSIEGSQSIKVDIRNGIGMDMTINNSSTSDLETSGTMLVSEISGPLAKEVVKKLMRNQEITLLAGGSAENKLKHQDNEQMATIRSADKEETVFYSIRRGWKLDLSEFTLGCDLETASLTLGDSVSMNVSVTFQDSDLAVPTPGITQSEFQASLMPAAWDSVLDKFVLLTGSVDTLANTASFTLPLLSFSRLDTLIGNTTATGDTTSLSLAAVSANLDQTALVTDIKPYYKMFTLGMVLDRTPPTIILETKSLTTSDPGPYKIVAHVQDDLIGVRDVYLHYEIRGKTESVPMVLKDGKYEGLIPSQKTGTMVKYYVEATDNHRNTSREPEFQNCILSICERSSVDLDNNGSINIFDLLAFLKGWQNNEMTCDINSDGQVDVWDMLTLLIVLRGENQALLSSSDSAESFSDLLRPDIQCSEEQPRYSNVFGISLRSRHEISAAELVFSISQELEIGHLDLKLEGPNVKMIYKLQGSRLSLLVFDLTGKPLPLGITLAEAGYRTKGNKPLSEAMIYLEKNSFGNLSWEKVDGLAILEGVVSLPRSFSLSQNYPNPFNPSTTISYDIPDAAPVQVNLRIYNLRGQLVKTLADEVKEPGSYTVQWDGMDGHGRLSASGIYFYRIQAGKFLRTRKMVILK